MPRLTAQLKLTTEQVTHHVKTGWEKGCSLASASQKSRQESHKPLHMGVLHPTEDPLAHRTKLGLLAGAGGDLWISLTIPPWAGGEDTQIRSPTAQLPSPAPPRGRDLACHRKASSGEQERNWLLRHQQKDER